ncbi:MAG TPA: LysR substrate-binding domain-containing protein [Candidatus Acidoferrales bacterium]|nr:LysR substrate-binding domain-containing protein [Candidatus Acidoferrales bacterium]
MVIAHMRVEKLRQVDLNLLIIFAVIAEEKSVTKASARLLLSQPAVSRALQRARSMFQDELVIRSSSGFELTLRGRKILQELEQLLPKIEGLVVPTVFDPTKERSIFRLSGPDNVCMALVPHLCRRYATEYFKVNFEFLPWQAEAVEMLERGKLDLILHIDDGLLPAHFSSERLYREDWICAVARQSKFGDRLTLKQYLDAEHLTVTTLPSVQNIPDKQLAALGARRRSSVRIPYFGAALSCLPGTELVLTLTNGMRQMVERNSTVRLVKAPQELRSFHFLMVWHPRLTSDARHTWLREAMRQASGQSSR